MIAVYIALGSNIEPEKNLIAAAGLLRKSFPDIRFSSVYHTKPQELTDQPNFLNAVACILTDRPVVEIHAMLRTMERTMHKKIPIRFGPRNIDLDLLLYGNEIIELPNLTIPHPRMQQRRFVLEPLCELTGGLGEHPVLHTTWNVLLNQTMEQGVKKDKKMQL